MGKAKARQQAPAARAQQARKRKAEEKAKSASSTVERLEAAEVSVRIRSGNKRQRTEQQAVKKVLADHFAGFSDEELYINQHQGRTLVERIMHDRSRVAAGEDIKFGKIYYITLRDLYRSTNSIADRLIPDDDNEEIDEGLVDAIVAITHGKGTTDQLRQWIDVQQDLNQATVCLLFQHLLKMPPSKSLENAGVSIAALKMMDRCGLTAKFKNELELMFSHWDAAACRSLLAMKAQQQAGVLWWTANKAWAKMIVPEGDADKVFQAQGSLESVKKHIDAVVDSSEVGRRLLATAQRQVQLDVVAGKIKTAVEVLRGKDLTPALLVREQRLFVDSLVAEGFNPAQRFAMKDCAFDYRGVEIMIGVCSPVEQYATAVQCLVRSLATDAGLLEPMWAESELVKNRKAHKKEIDPACYSDAHITRKILADELETDDASGENIMRVMKSKKNFLAHADRYWRIDRAFWSALVGENAEIRVQRLILDCLPGRSTSKTLAQSAKELAEMDASKLMGFVGPASRTTLKTVKGYVDAMSVGRPPALERLTGNGGFSQQVKERLGYFCVKQVAGGSGEGACAMKGERAAMMMLAELQEKKKSDVVTYRDLTEVLKFAWLLPQASNEKLQKLKNEVMAKSGMSSGGDDKASKSEASKKSVADARAAVRAIFKKRK